MRKGLKSLVVCAVVWVLCFCGVLLCPGAQRKTSPAASSRASTPARSYAISRDPYIGAIVVEASSGGVLFEHNADARGIPASVLKLMDLLVILEKIERGELSLKDQVPVSAKAARTEESQVWLAQGESFTVDEMLYALMIRSANDAAVALAEKAGGSTAGFVQLMNKKARELGMKDTVFTSVNGLPAIRGQGDDLTTARDLSILCREIVKRPEALRYTSARQRTFRPGKKNRVEMYTHNPLLKSVPGCDGLKTGYIAKAGFSIAVSAARNGQRVIVVVLGSKDRHVRDRKAAELVEKGFAALGQSVVKKR